MAGTALCASDEKANFYRLTRLLVCGGITLLREVFDSIHPPANLSITMNNPATKKHLQWLRDHKKVITQQEWKCLYPSPGICGKSTDFDITLLFKLFRNICSLAPPVSGWDHLPNTTDHSREADLARIKFYRNGVHGHSNDMEISDAEFVKLWREISEALLRIAGSISNTKKAEWKVAIDNFLSEPLTPDAKRSVAELDLWYKKDADTLAELQSLRNEVEQINSKLKQLTISIHTIVETLKPCELTAGPSHLSSASRYVRRVGGMLPESMCIPIPPEQLQAEGAAGHSRREPQTNTQNPSTVLNFWHVVYSCKRYIDGLLEYLRRTLGLDVQDNRLGSLVVKVSCSSLEVLDRLWADYCSGHLNEVIQETLVTENVLKELCLSEVKLKTIIPEEEYRAYKELLQHRSADTVSQQPCVEEETSTSGASAADNTVGATAADSDESEHSEKQERDTKETTESEAESSCKKDWDTFKQKCLTILERCTSADLDEMKTMLKDTLPEIKFQIEAPHELVSLLVNIQWLSPDNLYFLATLLSSVDRPGLRYQLLEGHLFEGQTHYQELAKDEVNDIVKSGYVLMIDNQTTFRNLFELEWSFSEKFGFDVESRRNLTKSETLKLLKETGEKSFSMYDCFICVIASYGSKDGIYGKDDEVISLDTITSLFSQNKCPSLKGKPKIFLIEAVQRGDKVPSSDPSSSPTVSEADFLINYVTPEEEKMSSDFGFISAVHHVFEVYSGKEDLVNMMTRVNKLTTKSYGDSKMQSPTLVSTLTKKVFFKPRRSGLSTSFLW